MRSATLLLALLVCCPSPAQAPKLSDEEARAGFVSMFNGQDFSGWQFGGGYGLPEKLPPNWKVEDGLIKLAGGGAPHLGSQWDYEDFDVRFEWRALKERYNSGFYIRSGRKVGANQINLARKAAGNLMGGAKGGKAVPELQKPVGEWNEWRVLAVGDKVTFWCNGKQAWEVTGFKTPKGYIGLQAEGAPMEFRNLRIKEIGWESLNDPDRWTGGAGALWGREGDRLVGKDGKIQETRKTDYRDFVLRLEWKGARGTAGLVRLKSPGADFVFGDTSAASDASSKAANPIGQWNYLEVRFVGGKRTVWLNGVTVEEKVPLKASGPTPIGLGMKGPRMEFRNIRIRELRP